jgi:hypothetical protein
MHSSFSGAQRYRIGGQTTESVHLSGNFGRCHASLSEDHRWFLRRGWERIRATIKDTVRPQNVGEPKRRGAETSGSAGRNDRRACSEECALHSCGGKFYNWCQDGSCHALGTATCSEQPLARNSHLLGAATSSKQASTAGSGGSRCAWLDLCECQLGES